MRPRDRRAPGCKELALGVFFAPWSILALPLYPAILVYGILRYELTLANVWARRAVAYVSIGVFAAAAAAPLSALAPKIDFWALWPLLALAMSLTLAFGGVITRAADLLIYVNAEISGPKLAQWRTSPHSLRPRTTTAPPRGGWASRASGC
jgi:hypothetical protein